jgi:hypothetical protein
MPKGGDCDMMCELFQFLYRQEPTLWFQTSLYYYV